ncbi:MAG: CHAT domain-containing tetratricopeptide repeat protein [Pseudomonadota bacterium]
MLNIVRLWILCLALCVAAPAAAQWQRPGDDDPEIAAQRAKVFSTSSAERAIESEKLIALMAARFGEDSPEYAGELQLHAVNLISAQRSPEAQRILQDLIPRLIAMHGADSSEVAFARRDYSIALRINGFTAEAEPVERAYVDKLADIAYGCGRIEQTNIAGIEGSIIRGCSHDERSLGTALIVHGNILHDLGRTDEAVARFEAVIARFTPRWEGCESEIWGTKCSRAEENRRAFMAEYARFLQNVKRNDDAMAILRGNLMPRLKALATCEAKSCEADYDLLRDFRNYRDFLVKIDMFSALQDMDNRWLSILANAPAYAPDPTGDTSYFDTRYSEIMDAILDDYAKRAVGSGDIEQALALLKPLGQENLVTDRMASANRDTRIARLDTAIKQAAGIGDDDLRERLLDEKAALIAQQSGEQSHELVRFWRDTAFQWRLADKYARAENAYRKALAVSRAGFGDGHFEVWHSLNRYADMLIQIGRTDDAIAMMRDILAHPDNDIMPIYNDPMQSRLLSDGFIDPYATLNELKATFATLLLDNGTEADLALEAARHAATGVRAYRDSLGFSRSDEKRLSYETSDPWAYGGVPRYRDYFILLADALWTVNQDNRANSEAAFIALQEAMIGTTSRAVAKAAAERAAERGGVDELLNERALIDTEIDELESRYYGRSTGLTREGRRGRDLRNYILRKRAELGIEDAPTLAQGDLASDRQAREAIYNAIRRKNFRRSEINQAIAVAAPGYFELVRPRPLDLASAQAMLGADEAFLLVVPSARGIHTLLLTGESVQWQRSALSEAELNAHVRRLLWDLGANVQVSEEENARWLGEGEGPYPFDRATAHLLYRELVAPFARQIAGKRHLFVAATGALSSLPFGVLVTEQPVGADGDADILRATPWLADRIALVQLPSFQSLQLLRALEQDSDVGDEAMMLGFGDPVLDGEPANRGTSARQRLTRAGGATPMSIWRNNGGTSASLRLADPEKLRKLARLPGTKRELRAMERVFGIGRTRLFLAEKATETNIKNTDLGNLSVLFLATHGLVAGEMEGEIAEPGLLFTPPQIATQADDGLLTASEVTALPLDVQWVILSACNTAAGDGSEGAEGLSGLARSFFYAGAESLLASHWPVRDDVAAVMTVRLFELQRDNPGWSRAEALQAAMAAVRNDRRADDDLASWSHPSAWAPFSYIGDIR